MAPLNCGGIFSQSSGTAVESAEQVLGAFKQAEDLLAYFYKLLKKACDDGDIPRNFDVESLIPNVSPGTLGREQPACSQSDHVFAAQATVVELQKSLSNLKYTLNCQDHVRTNMADAGATATNTHLLMLLGEKESEGYSGNGNLVNTFIRGLYKNFQDTSYEYGCANEFRVWMDMFYPGQRITTRRVTGNRNDVYAENAAIILAILKYYTEFLMNRTKSKTGGLNQLESLLLKQCGSSAIRTDLRARALLWISLLQPFRTVSNETDLGRGYSDMYKPIQVMEKVLTTASAEGLEGMLGPGVPDWFEDPELKQHTDKYREKNSRAYATACADDDEIAELFSMKLQKSMAAAALSKLRDLAGCSQRKASTGSQRNSIAKIWQARFPQTAPLRPGSRILISTQEPS